MTRKTRLGLLGYTGSVTIVLLVGIAAVWLMDVHPVSGFILLLAVGFALAGLGQRWYRRFRQLRRRAAAEKLIRI